MWDSNTQTAGPLSLVTGDSNTTDSWPVLSPESRAVHLCALVQEAELRVSELGAQVTGAGPAEREESERERQLKAWEWRLRLYKRMQTGYTHANCHGVTQNGSGSSSVTSPALVLVETPNEPVCGGTVVSTKMDGLLSHVQKAWCPSTSTPTAPSAGTVDDSTHQPSSSSSGSREQQCGAAVWNSSVEQQCGAAVWSSSVEQQCGTAVWSSSVEQQCGTAVWNSSVEQQCGAAVWSSSVEQQCGTAVWSSSVEQQCGAAVWSSSVEQQCGTAVWNSSVEQQCGAAVWNSSVEQQCGAAVWSSSVEQQCGAAVWNSSVEQQCGAAVWSSSVEQQCWRDVDGRAPRLRGLREALDQILEQIKEAHQHCTCHGKIMPSQHTNTCMFSTY
ncbi:hypothetical protein NFI96_004221 [Prochilodus magdalenae]|nr:hypothetical protein NFI96_004221 [Prochilodus magdalenae]